MEMKKFGNILWGIVLIIVGLILAGNAIGITNINLFFDGWWTLFIIIPCSIGLLKEQEKTGNIIGLVIGISLLLCCRGYIDFDMLWKLLLPVILIIIGISLIFKDAINSKVSKDIKKLNETKTKEDGYYATFASQDINYNNQEFNGTDLTAIFGGIKCDLRKAIITKDIVINCSASFAGIEVYIPDNVQIKIKSVPIFGGVSDKSEHTHKEDAYTIYINAQCVFGGVEIK